MLALYVFAVQTIVILVEALFFVQYSFLGVVPSISLLALVLLSQRASLGLMFTLSIYSGLLLDIIRPAYSPWYLVIFLFAGTIILISKIILNNKKDIWPLVLSIFFKHALFIGLYVTHINMLSAGVIAVLDVALVASFYIIVMQAYKNGSSAYETSS